MKNVWKKVIGFLIVFGLIFTFVIASMDVEASQKAVSPKDVFQIVKQKSKSKARKTEPEEWNQPEIKSYRFDTAYSAMSYLLTGGIKYYNTNFLKLSKKVKITLVEDGTFFLSADQDAEEPIPIYDQNLKFIGNMSDEEFIRVNGKAGDSYYVEFSKNSKEALLMSYVLKDSFSTVKSDDITLQKGEGKPTYHTFTLKKRSFALIEWNTLNKEGGNFSVHLEKKEKGKWISIGKKYQMIADDEETGIYGLREGKYRLVLNGEKDQVCTVEYIHESVKKKVAYKRSKAKTVKVGKVAKNIYTTGERASRWYKVAVNSTKKQRKIQIYGASDNGKFKFTIYRSGRKKPVKIKKISNGKTYTYKAPKKKATYYVKVSKIGKRTNGYYDIEFE